MDAAEEPRQVEPDGQPAYKLDISARFIWIKKILPFF